VTLPACVGVAARSISTLLPNQDLRQYAFDALVPFPVLVHERSQIYSFRPPSQPEATHHKLLCFNSSTVVGIKQSEQTLCFGNVKIHSLEVKLDLGVVQASFEVFPC